MEGECQAKSLVTCLCGIADPRMEGKSEDLLIDILVIFICAVICGGEPWTGIGAFGICKKKWFSSFLDLPNGIPSHDTIGRVFSIIAPEQFQECYLDWIQ